MPYYKYMCDNCGLEVTLYVSFEDLNSEKGQVCERCGSSLDRILFSENIMFGDVRQDDRVPDDDDYVTVKKRLSKEIERKKRDLEEYKKETKEYFDNL